MLNHLLLVSSGIFKVYMQGSNEAGQFYTGCIAFLGAILYCPRLIVRP